VGWNGEMENDTNGPYHHHHLPSTVSALQTHSYCTYVYQNNFYHLECPNLIANDSTTLSGNTLNGHINTSTGHNATLTSPTAPLHPNNNFYHSNHPY